MAFASPGLLNCSTGSPDDPVQQYTCVDPTADLYYCGDCNTMCPSGVSCVNGSCNTPALPSTCQGLKDGALCNDGNLCTQIDTCRKGVCVGREPTVNCTFECRAASSCDPATGRCSPGVPQPNGTACSGGGTCIEGVCTIGEFLRASHESGYRAPHCYATVLSYRRTPIVCMVDNACSGAHEQ
jgi:hypothetical protein